MELLKIDLTGIIRSRVGGFRGKLIPGFVLNALERLIHQDELNEVLEKTYPKEGAEFAAGVSNEMHRYDVAFVFDSLGYERFVPFEIADLAVVPEARAKSGGEYYYLSVRSVSNF